MKISFEKALAIALEQHDAGRFERAEALYLEILRQDPGNVDAIHLLGVLANQGKQPETAIDLISAAIRKRPDVPIFHYNIADAYSALKRYDEAIESLRTAVQLEPAYAAALSNLGNLLNLQSQFAEAEPFCRASVEVLPDGPIGWNNLANALRGQLKFAEAESAYRKAVALQPDYAQAWNNLGLLLGTQGQLDAAIEAFKKSVEAVPAVAAVHVNLGYVYRHKRLLEDAGNSFKTATELDPENAVGIYSLGSVLRDLGRMEEALRLFKRALEIDEKYLDAHAGLASTLNDLGRRDDALKAIDVAIVGTPDNAQNHFIRAMILRDLNRHDDSEDSLREALRIQPENVGMLTALGYALQERGELDAAMDALNKSLELKPDHGTHSNVLLTVNYHPGYSPADLLAAHQSWAELHEKPHVPNWKPHLNDRSPDRKLRIGYVSPDFRGHVVGFFLEPILENHDHDHFEIYAYAHLVNADMQTWRMRASIDHWRETATVQADQISEKIREDQIDILVELAGHTGGNLLPVFARKPAPIQINMIGFPSTTGLTAMDYRITDDRCDPKGETDAFNSEKLLRLPHLFWAYEPPHQSPEVGPLPADRNRYFTFTSVNNFTKVTPYVQQMWAKLLVAVPESRLIMQTSALNSLRTQQRVRAIFESEGVAFDRIEFRKSTGLAEYLQLLNDSDITLDPFPFNGGTTTCHSLWMGAPVITLAGDRHASRMGLSMLTDIGLPGFIAHSPEEYVEIGKRMAGNLPKLRDIRSGMRQRLQASHLLDGPGYTRDLENAYRAVWKQWCEQQALPPLI